jgi:hypothetical protein
MKLSSFVQLFVVQAGRACRVVDLHEVWETTLGKNKGLK